MKSEYNCIAILDSQTAYLWICMHKQGIQKIHKRSYAIRVQEVKFTKQVFFFERGFFSCFCFAWFLRFSAVFCVSR